MTAKLKANKGQAIIEFAVVLPVMLIILLGIIDFGIVFYNKAMLTNASREGARAAITYTTVSGLYWPETSMQAAAVAAVTNYLQNQGKLITFGTYTAPTVLADRDGGSPGDPHNPDPVAGGTATVTVTWQHTFLAIPNFLGFSNPIIGAETVMRLE